jgi:membrane associated rhomboid family serine protease
MDSLALRSAWRTLRSVPLTAGYLLVLTGTTVVLSVASRDSDDRLLFAFSTNLHQLARVPIRVLVGSAFWTSGWVELACWAVLFCAVLAPVERRLGWRRTLLAFAAGHIGATLIVAIGLWITVSAGAVSRSVTLARDVGVSYGFFAVAAVAAYLLTPRARVWYLAGLVAYVAAAAAGSHTFTDFGHLAAVALGLVCAPLGRDVSRGRAPTLQEAVDLGVVCAGAETRRGVGPHGGGGVPECHPHAQHARELDRGAYVLRHQLQPEARVERS